jgi:hypothetical protein
MAEIKSTLDIIMERTRGLRMTEAEKRSFKEQETAGKIKGLVQKCLDGAIDLSRFQEQATGLKNEVRDEMMVGRLFAEECLDRIELGKDNERLFGMIEKTANLDVPGLKEKLKEIEARVKQEKVIRESRLTAGLKERGVSGSAVIPNISADPGWNEYVGKMKQAFKKEVLGTGYKAQGKK